MMKDRQWNTPNQTDPWEACAEWEAWVAEQLPESPSILEAWEELDSWFKPQIYSVFCDIEDKHNATIQQQAEELRYAEMEIAELKTEYGKQVERQAEQVGKLLASLELALNQRKIDKAENQRLKDGYRQIKILNADKDADIKWLCEQALAAQPQKGQDNESPKVTA